MTAKHSDLGPSGAARWLRCPGSVSLIKKIYPDGPPDAGPYAQEGTWAHDLAEIVASERLGHKTRAQTQRRVRAWKKRVPEEYHDEMQGHAEAYAEVLAEIVEWDDNPLVMLEQRVHSGVDPVWGTADAIIVTAGELHVVDYKYGRGVQVSSTDNEQLKIYALGAYEAVTGLMGDALGDLSTIHITIYQPRVSNPLTSAQLDLEELLQWRREVLRPGAAAAQSDYGALNPSDEACRFCPVAGFCKPRAERATSQDFGDPRVMSPEDMANALAQLEQIEQWCKAVREAALEVAFERGEEIPGWKVVRAQANRRITDKPKAIELLVQAGYERDKIAREDTQTLGVLDRLTGGKDALKDILGDLIETPQGKATLVQADDPRPAVSAQIEAKQDFSPVDAGGAEIRKRDNEKKRK